MPQAAATKNAAPLATWVPTSQRDRSSSVWSMYSGGQGVAPMSNLQVRLGRAPYSAKLVASAATETAASVASATRKAQPLPRWPFWNCPAPNGMKLTRNELRAKRFSTTAGPARSLSHCSRSRCRASEASRCLASRVATSASWACRTSLKRSTTWGGSSKGSKR